jgi:hypothetical protein
MVELKIEKRGILYEQLLTIYSSIIFEQTNGGKIFIIEGFIVGNK